MSSPTTEMEEPTSTTHNMDSGMGGSTVESASTESLRPPAKRRLSSTVIEISDTDTDDSDICAVNTYQASADEVKKIRGEYSSTSSSSDYSSDSESPWEDDSIVLDDAKEQTKLMQAKLNPRANRMDEPKLNPELKSQELIDKLRIQWTERNDYSSEDVTLTCDPFRLCVLHRALADPDMINNIVDDMNTLDWTRKKMDLYEFHQTADLASLTWQRSIRGIHNLLKTDVMDLVSRVTGLELSGVSASCSLYGPGDHLLPHDDRRADRRVAFILYLAPWTPPDDVTHRHNGDAPPVEVEYSGCGWRPSMGGALQLFAGDEHGQPGTVVRDLVPANNKLAFFQVGADSFHQVEEVVSLELPRLSINGWFHGPAPPAPADPDPPAPPPPVPVRPHTQVVLMNQWLEPLYMSPRTRAQIQAQMERESEVCLRDLLQPARLSELLTALGDPDVPWELCGPANQRRYTRVPELWVEGLDKEHPVRSVLRLFSSVAFCRMLADCTDLTLSTLQRLELQRWSAGDYTLLPPREHYQEPRLEAVLYVGAPARTVSGGAVSYLAPEEEGGGGDAAEGGGGGALVTVPPQDNALSLVYCDAGAVGFTKYLSKMTMSPHEHFYIVTCTYKE